MTTSWFNTLKSLGVLQLMFLVNHIKHMVWWKYYPFIVYLIQSNYITLLNLYNNNNLSVIYDSCLTYKTSKMNQLSINDILFRLINFIWFIYTKLFKYLKQIIIFILTNFEIFFKIRYLIMVIITIITKN